MAIKRFSTCAGLAAWVGLMGCGGELSETSIETPEPRLDCSTASDGPRIPLDPRRQQEVVLTLGDLPNRLVFDYRSAFPFRISTAEFSYDFDRSQRISSPVLSIDPPCPTGVSMTELLPGLPDEGVYSGLLTVTEERTASVRQARITFARGQHTIHFKTDAPPLQQGDEDMPLYLLFEPAAGRGRVVIAPVTDPQMLQGGGADLVDVPSELGEWALVGSDAIVFNETEGVFSVPSDFGFSWRRFVSPWFSGVQRGGESEIELIKVRSSNEAIEGPPALTDVETFEAGQTSKLVSVVSRVRTATVAVPCPSSSLAITVFGFGVVEVGETIGEPGGLALVPVACEPDQSEALLPISVFVSNQRLVVLRLEYQP